MRKIIIGLGVAAWLAVFIWGAIGVFQRLTVGHHLANYGSYVPWGLWVAAKIYFVGISVGSSFFAWVVYAFGIRRFRGLIRTALMLSLINMVVGLLVISFDLGHMWRAYEGFLKPNFTSMLTISSWFSFAYLVFVVLVLIGELSSSDPDRASFRLLGWIGIFFALAFSGANGAEFAALISSPVWHSALGPIMSIAGALFSGFALVLAAGAFFPMEKDGASSETLSAMSRVVLALLLFVLLLEWSEFSISMWYSRGEEFHLLKSILFGQYWYVFWIYHIVLGSAVPMVLFLFRPAKAWAAGLGGLFAAVFYFAVRLNHVIPGQISPAMKGMQDAYVDHRLSFSYFPSFHEWSVFAFSVTLALALFFVGHRLLPLISVRLAERRH